MILASVSYLRPSDSSVSKNLADVPSLLMLANAQAWTPCTRRSGGRRSAVSLAAS